MALFDVIIRTTILRSAVVEAQDAQAAKEFGDCVDRHYFDSNPDEETTVEVTPRTDAGTAAFTVDADGDEITEEDEEDEDGDDGEY